MIAVKSPAVLKEKVEGSKFTRALAGATTLAAMFVVRVAKITPTRDKKIGRTPSMRAKSSIGSEIACPKITTVAEVTATPTKVKAAMKRGKPIA